QPINANVEQTANRRAGDEEEHKLDHQERGWGQRPIVRKDCVEKHANDLVALVNEPLLPGYCSKFRGILAHRVYGALAEPRLSPATISAIVRPSTDLESSTELMYTKARLGRQEAANST